MKGENLFDTIVAIAIFHGLGGIAVLRISGEKSFDITSKIIKPDISNAENKKLLYRSIHTIDEGKLIDKCLVALFKSPNSYTGEDVVEIYSHGGLAIPNIILEELLKAGSRMAMAGEFTKRAYINNKIDLIQAEAIEEMISAKTKDAVFLATSNLDKNFSKITNSIKKKLIDILALIEVNIDYPEEELESVDYTQIKSNIHKIKNTINHLIEDTERGRIILNGVKMAIVGKTNVGKSSLMNCLLNEDRAIVSDIHGTTRDYIDAVINIGGIPVTIIDTAGIRSTTNKIEEIGTVKSKEIINKSDIMLFVVDGLTGINKEDLDIFNLVKEKNHIIVINKIDELSNPNTTINNIMKDKLNNSSDDDLILISALKDININLLEKSILDKIQSSISTSNNQKEILVNARHKNCLLKIKECLNNAETSIEQNISYEFIALDIRKALDTLGEVIGEVETDEILDNIFNNFCVGK